MKRVAKYFVLHLGPADFRPRQDAEYLIQLLDDEGDEIVSAYVGRSEVATQAGQLQVPRTVIEAARRQLVGKGDYVDSEGKSVPPF